MAKFRYLGTEERAFLFPQALVVSPGEVVEATESPDEQWFEPVAAPKAKAAEKDEEV